MEVLIEIIVWFFKSLFGDSEKPADIGRGQRPLPSRRPQRGPYNYGDDQAGQTKTLEQILEEVRQQTAQKRSQGVPPVQPPSAPQQPQPMQRQQPRPAPGQRRGTRRAEPEASPTRGPQELPSLAMPQSMEGGLTGNAATTAEPPPPPPLEPVSLSASPEPITVQGITPIVTPVEATAVSAVSAEESAAAAKVAAAPPTAVAAGMVAILRAIRDATPEQKRKVALHAMVLNEVFGPPRSRRPHLAGRRAF